MRFIDWLLGLPACLCVAAIRRLRPHPARTGDDPRRILVVKFFGLGSILLATPMVRRLRECFPRAAITILTFGENREIASRLPVFDQARLIRSNVVGAFVSDTLAAMWDIWRGRYDLILDLEFFSYYSAFLCGLNLRRRSLGFAAIKRVREWMYDDLVSYEGGEHIVDKFNQFLPAFGVAPQTGAPLLPLVVTPAEQERVAALLAPLRGKRLIAVNINTGPLAPLRKWPLDYYQQLGETLLTDARAHLVLTGDGNDRPYVEQLARRLPAERVLNTAGTLNLGELFALLRSMDLFIGNDSGPAHLAEAGGAPSVILFGPETSRLYGPRDPRSVGLMSGHFCSPCLNVYDGKRYRCRDNICLKRILPAEVAAQARRILGAGQENRVHV